MAQSLFNFATYFKSFIGLSALVNPVGIIPVFTSMISYQPAAVRNKTNLTANLSVAIILPTLLFLGDGILQIFGVLTDSFRIAGGILVVTTAVLTISDKLGEDKQNKQERSETAARESISVVSPALPLMAEPEIISSTIVWDTRYHSWAHLAGFPLVIAIFALRCWSISRMTPWLVRLLEQTGTNVITRIMGSLLMALGIESIVIGIKAPSPGLFNQWDTMQVWRLHFALARLLAKPINQRRVGR